MSSEHGENDHRRKPSSPYMRMNFILLTIASVAIWLWSDGLTVEVPFLVPYLPEGWRLGSFLVLMKGLSTCSLLLLPLFLRRGVVSATLACYGLGLIFSVSICFLWDKKLHATKFFSKGLSIGFLANAFCLMGLDSIRMTLVYMLASSFFPESFITAVLIGDACGGLFASGVSYAQGYKQFKRPGSGSGIPFTPFSTLISNATEVPSLLTPEGGLFTTLLRNNLSKDFAFGPSTALLFLALLYLICLVCLCLMVYLNRMPYKRGYQKLGDNPQEDAESSPLHSGDRSSYAGDSNEDLQSQKSHETQREITDPEIRLVRSVQEISGRVSSAEAKWFYRDMYSEGHKYYLWFTWFVASGSVFTLMPAFHSYSTIPYSQRCFMLAVSFWSLSFPITAIIAHFVRLRKVVSLTLTLIFHMAVCGVLISIASQSPYPPYVDAKWAEPVIILLWVAQGSSGFFLFATASYCLREMNENAVKWGSIAAQVGDVAGAFMSFALINFSDAFTEP